VHGKIIYFSLSKPNNIYMGLLILLALVVGFYYFIKMLTEPEPIHVDPKYYKSSDDPDNIYTNKKMTIEVVGVGDYFDRGEAYDGINKNDVVLVYWDRDNEHDEDAIGVYTVSNELVGYLPRNRQKIINTLLYHPSDIFAIVADKWEEPSEKYGTFSRLKITMWLGYDKDLLDQINDKHAKS
jgi:hypothetical protein